MLFLDPQSRFFRSFIGRIRGFYFADPPGGEIGRSPCRRTLPRHRSRSASRRAAAALVGGREVAEDQPRSTDFKVVRRLLAAITDNLIFDRLTLVERTKAGTLDSGDMDEHVSAAIFGLNESIALGRVEPFDSASSHHRLLECTNVIGAARPSRDRSSEISVVLGKHPGMRNKQCQVRTLRF